MSLKLKYFLPLLVFVAKICFGLENGLVRTPPMGWMSWTKFYCQIDCERHPFSCINENLYMAMADRMAEDGYRDAGYEYVHIDDCWMEMSRDSSGRLVGDKNRFPSGIAALSEYIHDRGLKFGIYEDFGNLTCGGYPGSLGHLQMDAQTFADWKVDYLKLDGCYSTPEQMAEGYPEMTLYLNHTKRPIVYSCSWPAYLIDQPEKINYTIIGENCNLWRNFDDISRSWSSVMSIVNWYNANQELLQSAQGPGRWNDPDMIIVGNTELTVDQSKVQMTIWSIWSAPLIMSNDLRTITPEYRQILLNPRVIAVDQDPLGVMGQLVYHDLSVYVYVKRMTPIDTARNMYSYAVAVLNHGNTTIEFKTDLDSIGLRNSNGYDLLELWDGQKLGRFYPKDVYKVNLKPTSVAFVKAILPVY